MASNIFWLVVTATLLSLVTYCLFNPPGKSKDRGAEPRPPSSTWRSKIHEFLAQSTVKRVPPRGRGRISEARLIASPPPQRTRQ